MFFGSIDLINILLALIIFGHMRMVRVKSVLNGEDICLIKAAFWSTQVRIYAYNEQHTKIECPRTFYRGWEDTHYRDDDNITCFNVKRAVNRTSLPSRLYSGCGLSRMMKTMSAGILPCIWSPSFWNVTRVPDFQPGLIAMFTNLSSFFGVPSACMIRLEIFIFLTQPLLISSSVTYKSCSMGGSCVFSFCLCGVCTLNECDLSRWKKKITNSWISWCVAMWK